MVTSFCTRVNVLVLLLALSSPCKFIQSPMDLGHLNTLHTTSTASQDFGGMVFNTPSAVVRPQSPLDISLLLTFLSASPHNKVSVAARGAGHSIHGQAQAPGGIVVEMGSLPSNIEIHAAGFSYADVSGGALWIELLKESLKLGLAPRSWTDYLYLSIGGTLSNAGISGQTFKYGPQISNVLQLEVVTGKGELVTCSPSKSSELFYAVLGGLGQFGVITRARILLQEAPHKVKWVRAFYDDFHTFTKDQEMLISMADKVDYVEGFIVLNEQSLHSFSTAFPSNVDPIPGLSSNVHYCIEFVVHVYQAMDSNPEQVVEGILGQMGHMSSHVYIVEVSYFDFLNRVRLEEVGLRREGLWEVPHPWLNMFVPKSRITQFKNLLLDNISIHAFEGAILIYPFHLDKWNSNMSAVTPEAVDGEQMVYVVGVLQSASLAGCSAGCLAELLRRNRHIVEVSTNGHIGARQYLANHRSPAQWQGHFGSWAWERFVGRKAHFDPLALLGPGQSIFPRASMGAQSV